MQIYLVLSFFVLLGAVACAPAEESHHSHEDDGDIVYDQRQNGTENLRISLSDVMVVVAPAESLMPMAGDALSALALGSLKDKDCGQSGGRCKSATQRYDYFISGIKLNINLINNVADVIRTLVIQLQVNNPTFGAV